MKILKVKLEYWLPGITMGASGARQPDDISIKQDKITGQQENLSTNAHVERKREKNGRRGNMLFLCYEGV